MAQGRRISGILVPIQLDTSNVQKDMEDLSKGLGTVINSIQKKFEGALNTKDLANNVVKVTRAMGDLRDSADALGRINGVNIFKSNLSGLSPALKDISAAFGGTVQQQKELYSQLVKTQAIDQQVKALETLQRMLKITAQEAVKLAQSRGVKLSSEALSQVLPAVEIAPIEPSRFKRLADSLRTQFREAAQAAGVEGSAALERSFVKEGMLKQVYADIKKVAEGTGVAKSEMVAFFESIGKGGVWDKFNPIAQMKAQIEQLPKVLTGASESYKKYSELLFTSGFKETPGALGKYEQSLRDTAAINAAKELASVTGMSAKELRAEAEAAGFTKEMIDKLIPSTKQLTEFSSQLGKSAADYRRLATSAGVAPSQEGYQKFLDTANIRRSISAFEQLNIGQKLTSENFAQIASAAKVSTQQVADYVQAVTRANTVVAEKKEGRGLAGIFTPSSISAGAQSALAATGVVTGMYGITELVKSSYQAAMRMDNLNLSFESIYGSSAKAGAQMDFVRKISDELGMSFTDTAEGAKKLFAAARGTEVEKDANQIFKAFSTMGAALKLTGDETNSVFLAVSQMISKGKVSAEELRLQLAERMPGAVTLFAKSIGVTTKELDQMLQNGQVGLDSLRKFALEVQNTYAAGAAGASKGLQAELNRVSNTWFDLKRAFVDAKGSAETLSVISDVLKNIGSAAPAISSLAAVLTRLSVSIASVYAATKAILALREAVVAASGGAALFSGGLAKMGASLAAFVASPLGAAVALGAVVAGVWNFVSSQPDAMKAIEGYTYSFDAMGEAAKGAAEEVQKLNEENKKREVTLATKKAEASYGAFKSAVSPRTGSVEIEGMEIATPDYSAYFKSLQQLKKGGAAWNATVDAAQKLGADAGVELDKMIVEGSDPKVFKAKLDSYAIQFKSLFYDMKTAGASDEVTKQFDTITQSILGAANAADTDKRALKDLQDGTTSATDDLKTFSNAYDAIFKSAKETELGKQLTYQTEAKGAAKQLVDMVPAVEAARAKIAELQGQTAENNAELKAAQDIIQKNNDAFIMLGQAAIKSKMDLSVLQEGIRLAGEAAGLTAEKIKELQGQAAKGFRIGGIQTMGEIGAELDIEKLMAGATAGQKKTLSVLQGYAKDKQQALEMAKAVRKGSVEGLTIALKDPSVTQEDIAALWKKANEATASVDTASGAKKAQSNWESINSTIQQATKTLETWRSKVDESKSDQFGATIVSEVDKIDKAIRSSKGNSEQLAQLRSLREEILRTGELRKQQIKEEQDLQNRKELTHTGSRITKEYKSLVGVDNSEVFTAAKMQYDLDAEYFQKALEKKIISEEEYATYIKMMDATLADARVRSQTDMFSRLQVAANDYYKKYGDFTKHIGDVVTTAMDSSAKAIAAFARSGASDFASLASAFASMAENIYKTATDLFAQQAVSAIWKGLGSWIGGGGVGADTGAASDALARENISYGMQANGGVFGGGSLSSFSGSIVSSPTLFSAGTKVPAYATGAGLMGEAGPEGIFPLTRVNGKLGVRAEMGASQPTILNQAVNVNVSNTSGSQVTTQQTKDNQGNINIDVMIEEAVGKSMRRPGSSPYKSLQSNFGARQQLASV